MDSLIFFLVVMAIIITNVIKAKKKFGKGGIARRDTESPAEPELSPGPNPERGGEKKTAGRWHGNIREMLSELQKEMARATEDKQKPSAPPGRSPGWEDLLSSEKQPAEEAFQPVPVSREKQQPEPRRSARPSRGLTLIESRSQQGWTPEARIGVTERRQPAPSAIEPEVVSKAGPRGFKYSRDELRRAVIWYEVLGPPMSLRDPEREMWL